jgi:cytoskeletal protein RodZ
MSTNFRDSALLPIFYVIFSTHLGGERTGHVIMPAGGGDMMGKYRLPGGMLPSAGLFLAGLIIGIVGCWTVSTALGSTTMVQATNEETSVSQASENAKPGLAIELAAIGATPEAVKETASMVVKKAESNADAALPLTDTSAESLSIEPTQVASRGDRPTAETLSNSQAPITTPEATAPRATATPTAVPTAAPTVLPPKLAGKHIGIQAGHWQT